MPSIYLTDYSDNIIVMKLGMMSWALHVACMGEMRNACNVLVGKPEGKRPSGRHRRRKEDNIEINLMKWDTKMLNGFIWLRIGISEDDN
jgi:hypothetical protein